MERNMKITDSSNPNQNIGDLDYSSDSSFEDYYLHDEQDKNLINFADRWLVSACEEGRIPWDSDPVRIANFLKEINEKYGWNIPIDMNDIKKKLAIIDKKIKKMSKLYNNSTMHAEEDDCKKSSMKIRKCSTSRLSTQISETMVHENPSTDENPIQETTVAGDQENPAANQEEDDCKKRSMEIRKCSNSRLSAQISETMFQENPSTVNVDANPNQETMVADDQENPAANQEPPQDSSVSFIRRKLNKTDICDHQNRLSMPCNQVNGNFLTSEELEKLWKFTLVPAKLIDPGNRTYDINLRLTKAGQTAFSYAIGKPWNEIKRINGFETGTVLDVRGLRRDTGELCFLLKKVG